MADLFKAAAAFLSKNSRLQFKGSFSAMRQTLNYSPDCVNVFGTHSALALKMWVAQPSMKRGSRVNHSTTMRVKSARTLASA